MKKRDNVLFRLFILTIVTLFSFYRVDFAVAMAADENMESAVELEEEEASVPDNNQEEEKAPAPAVNQEEEEAPAPAINQEEEEASVPANNQEEEEAPAPANNQEEEEAPVPDNNQEEEEVPAPAINQETEENPEQCVSTGSELIAWLESHKNAGGTVKLSDNVVLDGEYCFCPGGINMPTVFVDTGKYSVTVAGEIELLSDNHLIFSGQPDGKSIFYIAPQGMLSMEGITVESDRGALWQEEGAGLVVDSCSVSGDIHYADSPFVMYYNHSICTIVEKGQTVNDVLPSQISCTVNREGQLFGNEPVSISWNTEGTEKQQEERRRFEIQGSFLSAASEEVVFCTVVYNDYPLTFTDVQASTNGFTYTFLGGFTAPEESLPFMVMSEYSFDGENWILFDEQPVTNTDAWFYITCEHEQRGRSVMPSIYIRLQWNDNGTRYFSNVLCYSTDNLDIVEDMGGSRGGGTSIVNPPDEPVSPGGEESDQNTGGETSSENAGSNTSSGNAGSESSSAGAKHTKKGDGDSGQTQTVTETSYAEYFDADTGQLPNVDSPNTNVNEEPQLQAEAQNTDKDRPSDTGHSNTSEKQVLYAESNLDDTAVLNRNDADVSGKEQGNPAVVSVKEDGGENLPRAGEQALYTDTWQGSYIFIAAGFVLLSAVGGVAGFYFHSRSGTNR